jgi:hypothetical protein
LSIMNGHMAKTMTKQARAPRLQPAKIKMRSHLLTVTPAGQHLEE